jgi:putative DNA primase/helicase
MVSQNLLADGAAAELSRVLGGRRSGRSWVARCPAHDDRQPSLSIADGADGRLLLRCFAGCSWSAIQAALEAKSLWPGRNAYLPGSAQGWGPPRGQRRLVRQPGQLTCLRRIWHRGTPAPGTEVETYLMSRALTTPVPPTLRYLRLRHWESGLWLPCMLAAVQDGTGRLAGLHRTYLRPDGCGKANVDPVRKMLGACRGGAVRLSPVGTRLALCEGIETALSVLEVSPDLAIWCSLSAGNLDQLTLPPVVEEIVLVADGDHVGLAAAHRAAQRYGATGRRVRLVELPRGMDANDVLRREASVA